MDVVVFCFPLNGEKDIERMLVLCFGPAVMFEAAFDSAFAWMECSFSILSYEKVCFAGAEYLKGNGVGKRDMVSVVDGLLRLCWERASASLLRGTW